jgi:glycerophosphoryl diester phosphodiesterase
MTASEVRALELRANDPEFRGEKVPLLADALRVAREAGVGVYLHVKAASAEAIAAALAGWSGPPMVVYSDYRWLRVLHLVAPDVAVMPELGEGGSVKDMAHDVDARWFASSISRLKMGDAEEVHRLRGRILVDVLGDDRGLERRIQHALSLGVDGVQVDAPGRALAVLRRAKRREAAPSASFPKPGD